MLLSHVCCGFNVKPAFYAEMEWFCFQKFWRVGYWFTETVVLWYINAVHLPLVKLLCVYLQVLAAAVLSLCVEGQDRASS